MVALHCLGQFFVGIRDEVYVHVVMFKMGYKVIRLFFPDLYAFGICCTNRLVEFLGKKAMEPHQQGASKVKFWFYCSL